MEHSLRSLVHKDSNISDAELDEFVALVGEDVLDSFWDSEQYEFNGNHVITDNQGDADDAVYEMCCGIYTTYHTLKSGRNIYFAFDYGH